MVTTRGPKHKFFHAATSLRRRRNRLEVLETQQGDLCEGEEVVGQEISDYFQRLFTTSDPSAGVHTWEGLQRKITDSMNVQLTKPIEDQEIKAALFSMNPHKAPGPDGMSPFFFQTFWSVLGNDLCAAVRGFLSLIIC